MQHMNGPRIVFLMRKHHQTIKGLAAAMGVTQKRVREVRAVGVVGHFSAFEWTLSITGRDIFNRALFDRESSKR